MHGLRTTAPVCEERERGREGGERGQRLPQRCAHASQLHAEQVAIRPPPLLSVLSTPKLTFRRATARLQVNCSVMFVFLCVFLCFCFVFDSCVAANDRCQKRAERDFFQSPRYKLCKRPPIDVDQSIMTGEKSAKSPRAYKLSLARAPFSLNCPPTLTICFSVRASKWLR